MLNLSTKYFPSEHPLLLRSALSCQHLERHLTSLRCSDTYFRDALFLGKIKPAYKGWPAAGCCSSTWANPRESPVLHQHSTSSPLTCPAARLRRTGTHRAGTLGSLPSPAAPRAGGLCNREGLCQPGVWSLLLLGLCAVAGDGAIPATVFPKVCGCTSQPRKPSSDTGGKGAGMC